MTNKEEIALIAKAEANIRADRRADIITKEQFQKEMHIMARARAQIETIGELE